MSRIILSACSDFVFKLIFGDQRNADSLAAFLQSVLDLPAEEYESLTIVDPHLKREGFDDKQGVLDVKINTKSGKVIDVEIQVENVPQMRERLVFYAAKMITEQIGKSEDYSKIKRVISIVITNYVLVEDNENYHNTYRLYDVKTGSQFTDLVEVNILELPKLPMEYDGTRLWDWLSFLKSKSEEELAMLAAKSPELKKVVGILKDLSADERTRLLEESREKFQRDQRARMSGARAEGIAEGEARGKIAVAKNLLKIKIPIEDIANVTGLSREEIEKL